MISVFLTVLSLFCWRTVALIKIEEDPDDKTMISSSGRYTVKEEIQKAPDTNHFCNLTVTSVKISFPEMKSRVFVNFLGYKVGCGYRGKVGNTKVLFLGTKLNKPHEMQGKVWEEPRLCCL